jgi:hypothetical protein
MFNVDLAICVWRERVFFGYKERREPIHIWRFKDKQRGLTQPLEKGQPWLSFFIFISFIM